jgi:CheY-like chemotaxis protein
VRVKISRHQMPKKDNQKRSRTSKAGILVVDDEPHVADTLRDILVYEGFKVEVADNGKQALDRLMSGHHFDLVITDMKMPEMDGLELLRRIRQLKLGKNVPIIVLTGYATLKSGLQAIKEGAYDYISKPFSINPLMNVVHEVLKTTIEGFSGKNRVRGRG